MEPRCPRLVVAGTAGDSGKTIASLGLLLAARRRGLSPAAFKKGPDYIDAAWLAWAAGAPTRNLDSFMQPAEALRQSFVRHASPELSLVEGNRGLLDGMDGEGTHSTAALARLLGAPVVLVVSAAKVTRTVAAPVLGCLQLEPEVTIAGVILNRVAGARHEAVARQAVERLAGVPVLGAIPHGRGPALLPDRHLGLVPPEEHGDVELAAQRILELVGGHVDLERILEVARGAPVLERAAPPPPAPVSRVKVGVFRDSAFTFYYPENLEALEASGAELVPISGLDDAHLPPGLGALYLGGGFPETHGPRLSQNESLRAEVRRAAEAGMPIHAECGGLIYLGRSLRTPEGTFPMAGVLPIDLVLEPRPVGHGYVSLSVDRENPLFPVGQELRGHEFHYTRVVVADPTSISLAFEVRRGAGAVDGRDGFVYKNVLAAYTHLHAVGVPQWAPALVDHAVRWTS